MPKQIYTAPAFEVVYNSFGGDRKRIIIDHHNALTAMAVAIGLDSDVQHGLILLKQITKPLNSGLGHSGFAGVSIHVSPPQTERIKE